MYYIGEFSGEADLKDLTVFKEKDVEDQPYIYQQPLDNRYTDDYTKSSISGINILNNSFRYIKPHTFSTNYGKLVKSIGDVVDTVLLDILSINDEEFKRNGVYNLDCVPHHYERRFAIINPLTNSVIEFKDGQKAFVPQAIIDTYNSHQFIGHKVLPVKGYSVFYEDIFIQLYKDDEKTYIAFIGSKYGDTYQIKELCGNEYNVIGYDFKGKNVYFIAKSNDVYYRYDGKGQYSVNRYYLFKKNIVDQTQEKYAIIYDFEKPMGLRVYGNIVHVLDKDKIVLLEYVDQSSSYSEDLRMLAAYYPFDYVKLIVSNPQHVNIYDWPARTDIVSKKIYGYNNMTVYNKLLASNQDSPKLTSVYKTVPDYIYKQNLFTDDPCIKTEYVQYKKVFLYGTNYFKNFVYSRKSRYEKRQISVRSYERNIDEELDLYSGQYYNVEGQIPKEQLLYYRLGVNDVIKHRLPFTDYQSAIRLKIRNYLDLFDIRNDESYKGEYEYNNPYKILDEDIIEYKSNQLYQFVKQHRILPQSALIFSFIQKANADQVNKTINDDVLYNISIFRNEKESIGLQYQKQIQQYKTEFLNSKQQVLFNSMDINHIVVDKYHPYYQMLFDIYDKSGIFFKDLKYGNLIIPKSDIDGKKVAVIPTAGYNELIDVIKEKLLYDNNNSMLAFKIAGQKLELKLLKKQ